MKEKLFGTDGIRGHANIYPMTIEMALSLGKAIGAMLKKKSGRHKVVIGKDTRLSCYMYESALIAGLCSMGVDTLMVGPLPTPGVAFITRAYRADAGIVISASHNPFYDNGIKIFSSEGFKLADESELELEGMMSSQDFSALMPLDEEVGRNKRIDDADGRYIEFAKATFPKGKTLKGIKIYLDCANGAAHRVAPLVFSELDAEVIVQGNDPNGLNINENCGALHPRALQQRVIVAQADVGIALDGDGDRVIMIDENGDIVDGDTLLAICALEMKATGQLTNNRVVGTVMTNLGVIQTLRAHEIEVFFSPVGDRYVISEMLARAAILGGEQSGHMIFLDHNTTGDGIVSALQVLRIMIQTQSRLSTLAAKIKKYPQTLVNVSVKSKPSLDKLPTVQHALNEVEKELQGQGRVLFRYSGTEMLARIMVEGPKREEIERYALKIAGNIKAEIGE